MSIWTRSELLALLEAWKAAYMAASTGKSYQISDRTLTRQDLPEIRNQLAFLQQELDALDGIGSLHFIPARVRR